MTSKKKKHFHRNSVSEENVNSSEIQKSQVQLFEYNKESIKETLDLKLVNFDVFQNSEFVSWLNLHGIEDHKPVELICSRLGIHDLVLEDILDTGQRPKLQEFEDYIQFSVKLVIPDEVNELKVEQISFILGRNYLLSFQEKKSEYFKEIRLRLREKKGIVRERTADYLLFLLIDAILDTYFKSIELTEEKVDKLVQFDQDSELKPEIVFQIEKIRTDVLLLKKLVEPLKTAVLNIENDQEFVHAKHIKYYTELADQCNQLLDETSTLYNRLESANNLFFSLQGYKMNQIMKILTIMATIFIPLTFIVGIYGMNFDVMPELRMKYGYFTIWGVMIAVITLMVIYFKRKKWF